MTSEDLTPRKGGTLAALRRRNDDLVTMVKLGKALTATLDLSEVLNAVMTTVCQTIKASTWSLLLLDERSQELIFEVVVSPAAERLKGKRLPAGQGIAGWVAAHGQPLLLPDVQQDARFNAEYDKDNLFVTRSIACVPLRSAEYIIGVIELINPFDEGFVDEDLLLLSTIADFAAIAIENARNYKRIQQLVITDDLTGLYNSRHMSKLIEIEVERACRYKKDLSLVFIDLDFFKTVNDTHGHLIGSLLLSELGDFLQKKIRKIDFAARYGGDEFVLVLPETSKAGALILCNHILDCLRQHQFLSDTGLPPTQVTASLGIATFPEDAASKDELLSKADQAMYFVKEHTRNGVHCA
ncbi:MAG: sensor domain-containing diguanylate cyclase [Desulfuromonadales bacterium]|nr:sensor domain-containing diguanylate cyclase [Desulfuromonadales bacterium]